MYDFCGPTLTRGFALRHVCSQLVRIRHEPLPGGGIPHNGLYGEASPERGTFFRLQVYKRVGISRAEVYERVGKSVV